MHWGGILSQNRQGVRLHSEKHIENSEMVMEINIC